MTRRHFFGRSLRRHLRGGPDPPADGGPVRCVSSRADKSRSSLSPGRGGVYDVAPRKPHFETKAKSVILLFMNGGPSPMDLLDPKPMLDKHHGEPYFDQVAVDVPSPQQAGGLLRSPFKFAQHGQSGTWVSEAMPHIARRVDDIAVIRSMHTTSPAHPAALYKFQGGRMLPGIPTLGAWVVYGLGTENRNLPAFVVLDDPQGLPINGIANWQSGFLPPIYQGTRLRSVGDPLLNLRPEAGGAHRPGEDGNPSPPAARPDPPEGPSGATRVGRPHRQL